MNQINAAASKPLDAAPRSSSINDKDNRCNTRDDRSSAPAIKMPQAPHQIADDLRAPIHNHFQHLKEIDQSSEEPREELSSEQSLSSQASQLDLLPTPILNSLYLFLNRTELGKFSTTCRSAAVSVQPALFCKKIAIEEKRYEDTTAALKRLISLTDRASYSQPESEEFEFLAEQLYWIYAPTLTAFKALLSSHPREPTALSYINTAPNGRKLVAAHTKLKLESNTRRVERSEQLTKQFGIRIDSDYFRALSHIEEMPCHLSDQAPIPPTTASIAAAKQITQSNLNDIRKQFSNYILSKPEAEREKVKLAIWFDPERNKAAQATIAYDKINHCFKAITYQSSLYPNLQVEIPSSYPMEAATLILMDHGRPVIEQTYCVDLTREPAVRQLRHPEMGWWGDSTWVEGEQTGLSGQLVVENSHCRFTSLTFTLGGAIEKWRSLSPLIKPLEQGEASI